MYCLVSAIWRNSRATAEVTASSILESWLISVERASISGSARFLKILAETSAPRLARKMAALRAPERVSSSPDMRAAPHRLQRLLLHHPRPHELGRRLWLRVGEAEGLLSHAVALLADARELGGHALHGGLVDVIRRAVGIRSGTARAPPLHVKRAGDFLE